MNNLKLNYEIVSSIDRQQFVTDNIDLSLLTENELETVANYILYGKDDDGTSVVDRGEVEIETRNKTWSKREHNSLDALTESAAATGIPIEGQYGLTSTPSGKKSNRIMYTSPRPTIDREKILALIKDGDPLKQQFLTLWRDIDDLEYVTTKYDLLHGKRVKPMRAPLIKLVGERASSLDQKAAEINQFTYLKMRHRLVQCRQLQYHLKDALGGSIIPVIGPTLVQDIPVITTALPSGLLPADMPTPKQLDPIWFADDRRQWLRRYLCNVPVKSKQKILDFSDPDHVSKIIYHLAALHEAAQAAEDIEERERYWSIFHTLDFYISNSKLNDIQIEVIKGKLLNYTNEKIRKIIQEKHNYNYQTVDYISTIFTRICCPEIARTANIYAEWLKTLAHVGRQGFKQCRKCNRYLLRSNQDFVKKARASDGLSTTCKDCDKEARKKR